MIVTITNVNEVLFNGQATSVNCPGSDGELTILPNHEPLVTTLKPGKIKLISDTSEEFSIKGGILEVAENEATILL